MDIELLLVPYDSGQRGWRCATGPEHLVRAGLPVHLQRQIPPPMQLTIRVYEVHAAQR